MKKKKRDIKINFSNRWIYTFIILGIIAIISASVYAYTSANGIGHEYTEIKPCSNGQILKVSGGVWTCASDAGGTTNPLYVEGTITSPVGVIRDANGGWVRTYGQTGWYSQTYGGGWYMIDPYWIRAFNDKNIYTPGLIQGGTLKVSGGSVPVLSTCSEPQWGEIRKCTSTSPSYFDYDLCVCSGTPWKWYSILIHYS